MIMRQMTQADYEYLMRYLRENAQTDAFGVEYRLKLNWEERGTFCSCGRTDTGGCT